jgi:uncharacterized protein
LPQRARRIFRLIVVVSASGVSPADQMNYGVAFHLEKAGFDQSLIDKALELRNLVNKYYRGQVSREKVAAELRRYENEPWFEKAYLSSSIKLPMDITQSKWFYEMDYEPLSIWKKVKQPALFLFAEVDEWVPIDQSIINYKNATVHLNDVTIKQSQRDGPPHEQSGHGEPANEYLNLLLDWLTSRLTTPRSS